MNLLYIGVSKENLEKYYPSYIKGRFLMDTYTEDELVDIVFQQNINVLMVDVFSAPFTASLLHRLKDQIKLINFSYQSIDSIIDLEEAARCGIDIRKLPDNIYCNEVAEFAIAQLLCACKGLIQFNKSTKSGEWNQAIHTNVSVRGKTLGIVGFGNIGKRIVELCENWGMNVIVSRKHIDKNPNARNVTFVEYSELIEQSDFIIFAVPLNDGTFHMFGKSHVGKLVNGSIIINISRGNVVDEDAIGEALASDKLFRYCTDVFSHEPVNDKHLFLESEKTILSPHVAWATEDTLKKTYDVWVKQTII
jgi:phosphoglycerate dehydrogenase-like enzyme